MRHIGLKIFIAVLTFIVGISLVYVMWLATRKPVVLSPIGVELQIPEPVPDTPIPSESSSKSARETWEELAKTGGCTFGNCYYRPEFDSYDPSKLPHGMWAESGIFFSPEWVSFFRRDKNETVPFLISQIPNKTKTNVHIDPFDMATKGELAIYCLQFILKVNWDELKPEYKTRLDNVDYEYTSVQEILRKIIGTRRGAKEMMQLWQNRYKLSS